MQWPGRRRLKAHHHFSRLGVVQIRQFFPRDDFFLLQELRGQLLQLFGLLLHRKRIDFLHDSLDFFRNILDFFFQIRLFSQDLSDDRSRIGFSAEGNRVLQRILADKLAKFHGEPILECLYLNVARKMKSVLS